MLKQNLNHTSHFAHHTSNKGITLIALVITIIIMLILIAVTISMAINGGLFEKAGEAVGDTKNSINYEQKLADGKIKIGDFWYASIDDYQNNNPITTGITVDKATLTLKKKESAEVEGEEILEGTITASVFGMDQEPEITWEVSPEDQTAVTLSGTTGKTITVTAVGTAKATVTVTAKCTYEGTLYSVPCEVKLKIMPIATLKVGDYVNYTPDTGTYKVASGSTGSGHSSEQSFTTGSNLSWRVWSINEETGEVEIVLATTGPSLRLAGADGYNHAVDILNDLCESLYSKKVNGTKVTTGRSINVEDINSKTTFVPSSYTNYGTKYTPSNKKYPKIYAAEIGSTANGLDETADLLEGSERGGPGAVNTSGVTEYSTYTDSTTASTLYATYTYYYYKAEDYLDTSLGINTAPAGLIKLSSNYWLASRCVGANSSCANFGVRYMSSGGYVSNNGLFHSCGEAYTPSYAVRPIVTLRSNVSLEYDSAKSTSSTTYWTAVFED